MAEEQIEAHTPAQSTVYHVLPGVLIGAFYFLIRGPIGDLGYPSVFALTLAVSFVLIPVELGILLYQAKRSTGRYTLKDVIAYLDPVPWWQVVLWALIVFVATGVIFTVLRPLETLLRENVFFWIPAVESGLDGGYPRTVLIVTYTTTMVFGVILGPLVEELYFRGYLLPRMEGTFAPVFHSFLFAAYHMFTPSRILTRTVGLLPLIYAVKKKNIYVGIVAHVMVNSLDVIAAAVFIAGMT